jgi:phospholipase C
MKRNELWRRSSATIALIGMMQPVVSAVAQTPENITIGPRSSDVVQQYVLDVTQEPVLTHAQKLQLLQKNIKYVFVLYQENRAYDADFGTFPGGNGLFTQSASKTPGFVQPIVETDGSVKTISPFLIPQTVTDTNGNAVLVYPADTDSVDHSESGIDNSMDLNANFVAANDRYALNEEGLTTKNGQIVSMSTGEAPTSNPSLESEQKGELALSHIDCDTIPLMWQFADRFTLFDNFHQSTIGPSTPNAINVIAAQTGETQWALHPSEGSNNTASPTVSESGGEPIAADTGPFPGSNLDTAPIRPAFNPTNPNAPPMPNVATSDPNTPALVQTYASLPLSFMGKDIEQIIQSDENPALDLLDVQHDIQTIASGAGPVNWGWYQEGFDQEPTDTNGTASHASYIVHHAAPQYFGYIGDNPKAAANMHGLNDFFNDVSGRKLPLDGGVFYVRGGFNNIVGLKPLDPNPTVQADFVGDDDHPGYSDAQISEALVAREVNTITSSSYWKNSVIIIAYDETDGLYDHDQPHVRTLDPEGSPLSAGPRIPSIVISPYGKVHAISHEYSEHASIVKFIDELYNLTPLADLPDEVRARKLGLQEFGQKDLGPTDDKVPEITDLFSAFDNARLLGQSDPLPATYAQTPDDVVGAIPPFHGNGCLALNIVPTDYVNGKLIDPAPEDFNPRPVTLPGPLTSSN